LPRPGRVLHFRPGAREEQQKLVRHTIYESRLAKLVLEHPELWSDTTAKVNRAVEELVERYPDHPGTRQMIRLAGGDLQTFLKRLRASNPGDAAFMFTVHKKLWEKLIDTLPLVRPIAQPPQRGTLSLFRLAQRQLAQDPAGMERLRKRVRSDDYFEPRARVTVEGHPERSAQIGITTPSTTPPDLQDYYRSTRPLTLMKYVRDPDSPLAKRMEERKIPFVGDISGTTGFMRRGVTQLDLFDRDELDRYTMALTANLVAQTHHSHFEVQVSYEKLRGLSLEAEDHAALCERSLTPELCALPEYGALVRSFREEAAAPPPSKKTKKKGQPRS
jgi:hypothetical protein